MPSRASTESRSVAIATTDPSLRRRAAWALQCLLAPLDLTWHLVEAPADVTAEGSTDGPAPAEGSTDGPAEGSTDVSVDGPAGAPDIGYGCPGRLLTLAHEPAAWRFTCVAPRGDDILAHTFWYLARVEELLAYDQPDPTAFDEHGRFRAAASVLAGADPASAPVDRHVLEIADTLGVAPAAWPDDHCFAVALTHDIDLPMRWNRQGIRRAVRSLRADLRARRIRPALRATADLLFVAPLARPLGRDPYRNALAIGIREAELGARSTSYLIAAHNHPADGDGASYARVRRAIARDVIDGGGVVGLHGSYTSSTTPGRLAAEREALSGETGRRLNDHRFHYLRHVPHLAWPELAAAGLRSDASLGYAEQPGFRSGCSWPYLAWNHAVDCPLDLVIVPLALMDATLEPRYLDALASGPAIAESLYAHAATHGSGFSLLWHNDKLLSADAAPWNDLYWQLLAAANEAGAWLTDTGSIADHWRTRLARSGA